MKKAGMNNVQLKLIAHARHDVFHELQSGAADEMTELLLSFLHSFLIAPRFPAADVYKRQILLRASVYG